MSWVVEVGERVPGWAVVLLAMLLIALLVGGKLLDISDTVARGIESKVGKELTELGGSMPEYGYRDVVRGAWGALTTAVGVLVVVLAIAKMANAVVKVGEED